MKKLMIMICVFSLCAMAVSAKDYKVSIFKLPVSESIANLFKAIGDATNNTFATEIVPPARGLYLIENKQVDVSFPATMSNDPKKSAAQNFDYSKAKAYTMIFVLYVNKGKPIDPAELKKGNPKNYKVETTASMARLFEFEPVVTANIDASLKRVDAGDADGLIYAQDSADPSLKKLGLKNIKRVFYSENDIRFALQKGQSGSELDKALSDGIAKLTANGQLKKILAASIANSVYSDWQP